MFKSFLWKLLQKSTDGRKKLYILKDYNRGFFAMLRTVLENIQYCESKGYCFIPDWTESRYVDQSRGYNAWDYYFEPISNLSLEEIEKSNYKVIKVDWSNSQRKMKRVRRNGKILSIREAYNYYLCSNIKIKKHITERMELFYNQHMLGRQVLGVHIRRTDKGSEAGFHDRSAYPIPDEQFIVNIDKYVKNNPECRVFVATDSLSSFDRLKGIYKERVISWDSFRSPNENSIHGGIYDDGAVGVSNYKKGEDALIDCLLLSKCDFLIRGQSSLSNVSLCFNLRLKQLNLNWLYQGCQEDRFIENTIL